MVLRDGAEHDLVHDALLLEAVQLVQPRIVQQHLPPCQLNQAGLTLLGHSLLTVLHRGVALFHFLVLRHLLRLLLGSHVVLEVVHNGHDELILVSVVLGLVHLAHQLDVHIVDVDVVHKVHRHEVLSLRLSITCHWALWGLSLHLLVRLGLQLLLFRKRMAVTFRRVERAVRGKVEQTTHRVELER